VTTKINTGGSTEIARLLTEMNRQGNFPIAVLTDKHGFPIASAAAPEQDPDTQSAVVALVQKTAGQVRQQLGMAQTDEISLYDTEGRRLVCRPFSANGHEMILAILIPDRHQSYRRLTNKAVSTIQRQWKL
jgi:predicted regulator of Ras-like GTPase activity (Roadblock/LC7/MglB family)